MKHRNRERRPSLNKPGLYEIRILGLLGSNWAARFGGLALAYDQDSGITILRGIVADQAKLHSLLQTIRDLNLPLLLVRYEGAAKDESR